MPTVEIPYSEDLLRASNRDAEELEQELRLILAVKLFEMKRLSLGKAAEMAGMGKVRFMEELARLEVAVIRLDEDQIRDELSGTGRERAAGPTAIA